MEIFSKIIELLVAYAWPAAFLAGLCWFRKPVTNLIGRLREVKYGKYSADLGPAPQAASPEETGDRLVSFDEASLNRLNVDTIYHPYYQQLTNTVIKALPDAVVRTKLGEKDVLIHGIVDLGIALKLERTYIPIFGSQIAALEFLRNQGGTANRETLRIFYAGAAANNPAFYGSYSYNQWSAYLVSSELIELSDDTVSLTAAGQAFLPYIASRGYSNAPPG